MLDGTYAEPHLNLARILHVRGEDSLADEHLARAIELDPRLGELLRGE